MCVVRMVGWERGMGGGGLDGCKRAEGKGWTLLGKDSHMIATEVSDGWGKRERERFRERERERKREREREREKVKDRRRGLKG